MGQFTESLRTHRRALAEECYTGYKTAYERQNHVALGEWKDLPPDVQFRWCEAVSSTADKLRVLEDVHDDLERAQTRIQQFHDDDARAAERLEALEAVVARATRMLPDMIALGALPGPFVDLVQSLRAALSAAHPTESTQPDAAPAEATQTVAA